SSKPTCERLKEVVLQLCRALRGQHKSSKVQKVDWRNRAAAEPVYHHHRYLLAQTTVTSAQLFKEDSPINLTERKRLLNELCCKGWILLNLLVGNRHDGPG